MKFKPIWIGWICSILFAACGGNCGSVSADRDVQGAVESLPSEEEWAVLLINGNRSGHVFSSRSEKNGKIVTVNRHELSMKRGAEVVSMTTVTTAIEDRNGEPISFEVKLAGSGMSKHVSGRIQDDDTATVVTRIAGSETTQSIPWPEDCLLMEGALQMSKKQGLREGVTYSVKVFDFESLSCLETDYRVGAIEELSTLESKTRGYRVEMDSATSGGAMRVVSWVDDRFRLIRSMTTLAGMKFETVACSKDAAMAPPDPSPLFTDSFINSPIPLSRKLRADRISYGIQPLDGNAKLIFPSSEEQEVSGKEILKVIVQNRPMKIGNELADIPSSKMATEFLEPTSWIQSRDSEIVALSKLAVGDAQYAGMAAKNIERFVGKYIANRSLSVGYASALETVRSRAGDCTEFALLSAALCRAAGIPARIVFGIVYMAEEFEGRKDFFGGHAWTQVLIDDEWYSIDAALGGFDAGHIAVLYNDGAPENFVSLINILGNFKILSAE